MKLKLKNVRLSFPALFEPEQYDAKSKPRYAANFLIPANSPMKAEIDAAIDATAAEKWGAKAKAHLKTILPDPKGCCWQDGDRKEYDGYAGNFSLAAYRYTERGRPLVLDADKSPLTEADGRPYAGCYVNATVDLYAQDNKQGKGIRAELLGVQFYRDGDAFAAGSKPSEDDFEDVAEGADAADGLV
jgi:hypothetical protein